jgi:hypothetical protein
MYSYGYPPIWKGFMIACSLASCFSLFSSIADYMYGWENVLSGYLKQQICRQTGLLVGPEYGYEGVLVS